MANLQIEEIEGIGPSYGRKLRAVGIASTDRLLEAAGTRPERKALAERTGIPESRLLSWVGRVDLCRVSGIGAEHAELLARSGVYGVRELALSDADRLVARCLEVNQERRITRRVPSPQALRGWIERARALAPLVEP